MNIEPILISIVAPVYKCSSSINELYRRLTTTLPDITNLYEIILVDDGSPEHDWEIIQELCASDIRVRGIKLSRNFGQHYAITAGLHHAVGEWIVVMDADLQDSPEAIPDLFKQAQVGYDSVFAVRMNRQDSFFKRWQSMLFYKVFSYLTDSNLDERIANFGIYHRKVITAILAMGDTIRYFPTMSQWVGFRKFYIPVVHSKRQVGKSSYSVFRLIRLAADTIITFSDKPLRLFIYAGIAVSSACITMALVYGYLYLFREIAVKGYTSIIISILFIGGIFLLSLGVVGAYIGKCFNQVKGRPSFIVQETAGNE